MPSHPYRDPDRKMSPMYFDIGQDRAYVDLRQISNLWLKDDGKWHVRVAGENWTFSSEYGARLYNALRAYNESEYGQ